MFFNKYIFRKECVKYSQDEILSTFEKNFHSTECYHKIFRRGNELDLKNDLFEFNYQYKFVSPVNLWIGVDDMNITVLPGESEGSHLIQFSVSFERQLFLLVFINVILGIILLFVNQIQFFYILILYDSISIIFGVVEFFLHRNFFYKTIKVGDLYKHQVIGSYDWELILKGKTNHEIMEIIQGRTCLPDIVVELATKELNNRKDIK